MIHINNTKQMLFLVILSVAILPVSISAKNYEARENLDIKSRMNGIPVSEVGLLERIPGLGVQEIADRIFNRFKTDKGRKNIGALSLEDNVDCFKQKESDHFEIRQKDGKWKLKVWIDGTRFIVSDRDYIEKNNIERIPVSKRFSNDKLEQIGRKFIKDYLQDIVVLTSTVDHHITCVSC